MILQTMEKLTKLNQIVDNPITIPFKSATRAYFIWKCIRSYAKNFKSYDTKNALIDLCYASSFVGINSIQNNDKTVKFEYTIENTATEVFTINIEYMDNILNIKIINGNIHYTFATSNYTYDGIYGSGKCDKNIEYEVNGTLITTFVEVLTLIFSRTIKYKYIL